MKTALFPGPIHERKEINLEIRNSGSEPVPTFLIS